MKYSNKSREDFGTRIDGLTPFVRFFCMTSEALQDESVLVDSFEPSLYRKTSIGTLGLGTNDPANSRIICHIYIQTGRLCVNY